MEDPTSARANDAPTNASTTKTTRKTLGAISDEVDALSHFGVTGVLCNRVMRKIPAIANNDSRDFGFISTFTLNPQLG